MPSNHTSEPLPEGFKSWKEFNKAKKERKRLKQEYKIKKLEEKKQKEELSKIVSANPETTSQKSKESDEPSTLSIAVPGSILDNAQSAELRTYLAGQIARAACVFKVDEIIVYDDIGIQDNVTAKTVPSLSDSGEVRPARRCCAQLARILQYLECPQYLRKEFFPKHHDLDYAGLLNPLDAPHHMRQQDDGQFREGIVINQPAKSGCYVNVGLLKNVKVDRPLQPGVRVTVEMLPSPPESKRLFGRVVPPSRPKKETGVYWGYSVRLASSFNAVFTECPFKDGYDVTVGTSERGERVEKVTFPSHQHALVVFGGLAGIEAALEADEVLMVDNPALLFDFYLNTCPDQGSRTIRTEEAILISLAELRTRLQPKFECKIKSNEVESSDSDSNISVDSENDESSKNQIAPALEEPPSSPMEDAQSSKITKLDSTLESCDSNSEKRKIKKRKKSKDASSDLL
ncbi:Putative methyltransferase C9orf114 [Frankliniella fusca]|uniref:Methyltransferase C9orf114 n=1 Tax=Frankliniella fusca TaxID=407009 RepID=A0AAE1LQ54_9NEOP|nr:Putative methyltransferase C9orf114 [Frankliniella fusca]